MSTNNGLHGSQLVNNINYLKHYIYSNMCLLVYIILNRSEEITESDAKSNTKNEKLLTQNSVLLSG